VHSSCRKSGIEKIKKLIGLKGIYSGTVSSTDGERFVVEIDAWASKVVRAFEEIQILYEMFGELPDAFFHPAKSFITTAH